MHESRITNHESQLPLHPLPRLGGAEVRVEVGVVGQDVLAQGSGPGVAIAAGQLHSLPGEGIVVRVHPANGLAELLRQPVHRLLPLVVCVHHHIADLTAGLADDAADLPDVANLLNLVLDEELTDLEVSSEPLRVEAEGAHDAVKQVSQTVQMTGGGAEGEEVLRHPEEGLHHAHHGGHAESRNLHNAKDVFFYFLPVHAVADAYPGPVGLDRGGGGGRTPGLEGPGEVGQVLLGNDLQAWGSAPIAGDDQFPQCLQGGHRGPDLAPKVEAADREHHLDHRVVGPGAGDVGEDLQGLQTLGVIGAEGDHCGHSGVVQQPVDAALKLPFGGDEETEGFYADSLPVYADDGLEPNAPGGAGGFALWGRFLSYQRCAAVGAGQAGAAGRQRRPALGAVVGDGPGHKNTPIYCCKRLK